MTVNFTEAAREEYRALVSQYDSLGSGLGDQFVDAVENRINTICEYPHSYGELLKTARKCNLGRFPYKMIYQIG